MNNPHHPQQSPQFPANPQPPPAAVQPKKSNAWKWLVGVLGGLVLLCGGGFVACTAFVAKGVNDAVDEVSEENRTRAAENQKSCSGRTYPDQQPDNDRCADASNTVVLDSVSVTATPLKRVNAELCTDVAYVNNSSGTISFNVFDWKLQVPTGEVKDAFDSSYTDDSLGSGDLVKGGTKTGRVCYEVSGGGQHILIYKPSFWSDARGIWVNAVTA